MKIDITIAHISDSDKHFWSACKEYEKRLGKQLTIKTLKPVKHGTQKQIIEKETKSIIDYLQKKPSDTTAILLTKSGRSLDSITFSKLLKKETLSWKKILFVIWGPYGLDESQIKEYIDMQLSFWAQTVPHGLAKLILLEQVYRAETILSGKKYHY